MGKGRRMAAGRGCFAPESRSLTTIHLNRASNIARPRACDVLSTDGIRKRFYRGNLCNIQALLSAVWRVLPLHFYSSRPSQVSAFNGIICNVRRNPLSPRKIRQARAFLRLLLYLSLAIDNAIYDYSNIKMEFRNIPAFMVRLNFFQMALIFLQLHSMD